MAEIKQSEDLQKATIYRLLSACFYQPEECFLEEEVFSQLAAALEATKSDLVTLAKEMDQAFRSAGGDNLLLDYSRLFLGPFEIKAKPYGSVYLDGEKVVMGDSTLSAKACYSLVNFDIAENFRELPDHITVELEFLYLLRFKQNLASSLQDKAELTRYSHLEQVFLRNHLGRWVKEFCKRIRDNAETDFYRLLAELTDKHIAQQIG